MNGTQITVTSFDETTKNVRVTLTDRDALHMRTADGRLYTLRMDDGELVLVRIG